MGALHSINECFSSLRVHFTTFVRPSPHSINECNCCFNRRSDRRCFIGIDCISLSIDHKLMHFYQTGLRFPNTKTTRNNEKKLGDFDKRLMHYEYVLKAWQQQKNQDQNSYDCGPLSLMAWLEQERVYSCSTKYHVPVHPLGRLWQIAFLNEMIHFAIYQFSHKNLK